MSLTSLGEVVKVNTQVFFCKNCGHLTSQDIDKIYKFYDEEYNININSEEEDQLYEVKKGKNYYRTEHQTNVLLTKNIIKSGWKILDYGCAKSSMGQQMMSFGLDIDLHLFDISKAYQKYWDKLVSKEKQAAYETPKTWDGTFDCVTSFFSLEHIDDLVSAMRHIHRLLKRNGVLYAVVPNVFTNLGDLIVVDHVNHFTESSLNYLLYTIGLEIVEIDSLSHRGALVVTARKVNSPSNKEIDISNLHSHVQDICNFWFKAGKRLKEAELKFNSISVIYGAGFYGKFILTQLQFPEKISHFYDSNEFLEGLSVNGIPIFKPGFLSNEFETVFVGLNPEIGKKVIEELPEFKDKNIIFLGT